MYLCVQLNKEKAYLNLDVNKLYNLYIYIYRVGLELIVISKQGTFTIENSTQDVSLKKKPKTNERTAVSLSFMDVNDKYYSFN